MSFEKVPYDKQRLETIRVRLESHERAGSPITYCVSIDGMEIIPKTIDATLFAEIYELLGEKTSTISISEYIGNTRNRNTTCFYFPSTSVNGQTLQGVEQTGQVESIQEQVRRQVAEITQKQTNDRLQRENQTLKQQLTALLERCDKHEDRYKEISEENDDLKKIVKENSEKSIIGQLGSEVLGHLLGKKQAEQPLEGVNVQEKKTEEEPQKKEEPTHFAVPEDEYKNFKFYNEFIQNFEPSARGLLVQINQLLGQHPELVEETYMNLFNTIQNGD